jgi:hypothetical protein
MSWLLVSRIFMDGRWGRGEANAVKWGPARTGESWVSGWDGVARNYRSLRDDKQKKYRCGGKGESER